MKISSSQSLCYSQEIEDVIQQAHKLRSAAMRDSAILIVNAIKNAVKRIRVFIVKKLQNKKLNPLALFNH